MKNMIAGLCAWDGTRRMPATMRRTPQAFGVPYEDVCFPSAASDGVQLSGWLLPRGSEAQGTILLCHGHRSNRTAMLRKAIMLYRHHFTTLLFDFRARGMSEGQYCTLGLRETDDVLGAVRYLTGRKDTQDLPIGVLGESMGGAAALCAAARCARIDAVASEAAFASLDRVVRRRLTLFLGPFAPSVVTACRDIGDREYGLKIETVVPEQEIARINPRPILLITDGLDLVCVRRESDRLFAAACEPKERWIVPSAPHVGAFYVATDAYEHRVSDFFRRSFSKSQHPA